MGIFFSIIIPTYNRALLISKAIDSVRTQTFTSWELLIVDDGSTDNTKIVVERYILKDKRVKYIFQSNAERSAARNNGIKNSTGKYICFLDSDDYFLPNRLELLFVELEKRKFPIAAFYTGIIIEKNGQLFPKTDENPTDNIFEFLALNSIHSQQVCIHSSILLDFKYDTKFRIGEDFELWLRIANKFPFLHLSNQQTIIVVDHDDRSVNVIRHNIYLDTLILFKHIFSSNIYGNHISLRVKNKIIGNCYYGVVKYNIYQHNRIKALYFILRSIFSDMNTHLLRFRINVFVKLLFGVSFKKVKKLIE